MGRQRGSEELDVWAGFVDEMEERRRGEDRGDGGAAAADGCAEDGHAAVLVELLFAFGG
jgi:hypothetical protein